MASATISSECKKFGKVVPKVSQHTRSEVFFPLIKNAFSNTLKRPGLNQTCLICKIAKRSYFVQINIPSACGLNMRLRIQLNGTLTR